MAFKDADWWRPTHLSSKYGEVCLLNKRSGREGPRRERSETLMEYMNLSWTSRGLVRHEGEGIPSEARWRNHVSRKQKWQRLHLHFICWESTFFWQLEKKHTHIYIADERTREQLQGSPRHCLLNWSKGGISPNANERRTIHVTQNIRYALNARGWGREVTFERF